MTAPRYLPLGQVDGLPSPKALSVDQLWKLASQRTSVVWIVCLSLIICVIFAPLFATDSRSLRYSAEEQPVMTVSPEQHPEEQLKTHSKDRPEMQPQISSSTHNASEKQQETKLPEKQSEARLEEKPETQAETHESEITPSTQDIASKKQPETKAPEKQHETKPEMSPSIQESIPPPLNSDVTKLIDFSVGGCNIFRGDWIPNPDPPAYTNSSCPFIHDHQNCLKNGKPDLAFLHWRWKPYDCELPLFDAKAFLQIVTGKKWAFVGDSICRNSYQSVLCLLSQVEMPECTYNDGYDGSVDWYFKSYNFTLAIRWAPYLVQFTENEAEGFAQGIEKLYVDVVHETWAPELHTFDYLVLSAGHWYLRPSVYFDKNKLVGSHYLPALNVTNVGFTYGYRTAFRTVFDFLISSNYTGVVFLRTFAPSHWENGPWNHGGNCPRKAPFESKFMSLEGSNLEMYKIQLEEFAKTAQRSSEFSFKLKIVDATHAALLRPDAHPGPYGYFQPKVQNDCLHWCLPGAVETWSAMFLDVLRHL